MLSIEQLAKSFGEVTALDGCSLSVGRGQMLGLLGPNGAGKTTVMRSVFGLVRPDGGRITWDGRPIDKTTRRRFGYMPEERGLYPKLPVRWQLSYLGRLHGLDPTEAITATDHWLDRFSLIDRADGLLRELSHGNQQRVQMIAALLHDPDLVVLDEPFAGLDPIGAEAMAVILRGLARQGKSVIFSSHQLDVVEDLCRDVVILHRGRVVLDGQVTELRSAAQERYVEVVGADQSWVANLPTAQVVERSADRIRARLDQPIALEHVVRQLARSDIIQFTYEPPQLSEVFRQAVGA